MVLQMVQLLGVPKLVNGTGEAVSCYYNCPRVGGLKVWLMPCALIPLLPILADEVELVVC